MEQSWNNPLWIEKRIKEQNDYLWDLFHREPSPRREEIFVSAMGVLHNLRSQLKELQDEKATSERANVS